MTQAKHTPGPLEIREGTYGHASTYDWQIVNKYGEYVCDGDGEANARIISAAPDLLDSHEPEREGADFLDWIADRFVHVYGESENVDFVICLRRRAAKARAAISKATGA